jgi:hypothetical protein
MSPRPLKIMSCRVSEIGRLRRYGGRMLTSSCAREAEEKERKFREQAWPTNRAQARTPTPRINITKPRCAID